MHETKYRIGTILPIYVPWLLSIATKHAPDVSYWTAWAGSFFVFYWTLFSPFRFLSWDLPLHRQVMRPIFLVQVIFAGFMCTTSIFYYLDQAGYRYFEKITTYALFSNKQIDLIAECQRLSLLGHSALSTGIVLATFWRGGAKKFRLASNLNIDNFLMLLAIFSFGGGLVIAGFSAISQFSIGLINTGIICGGFLLVKGVVERKMHILAVGSTVFIINFINATLTGYKEHILVNFMIIGCLFYPFYKRLTILIGVPVLYTLFYILPTYVTVIRSQSWSGEVTAEQARLEALETLLDDRRKEEIDETNWAFLTDRVSEIGMFTQFVENTPTKIDFYGFKIFQNSIEAIIPRFLWSDKPITEEVSMERVYEAGVVDRSSIVSAKTRPVVDGYLSGGAFGVFISMLVYGLITQAICNKAESLFGGYQLGSMIMFNGLFQPLWRGNNWEFLINSVFWSFILMLLIFQFLKANGYLVPVQHNESSSNQRLI